MHFLVGINNNIHEWQDTLKVGEDRPRLPLPYAFGAAFLKRGHKLSAIDVCSLAKRDAPSAPFERIYHLNEIITAMKSVNVVSFWGGLGVRAIFKQLLLPRPHKRVLLNTYVWKPDTFPSWKSNRLDLATRMAARFAKGVVVMTHEQAARAREDLPDRVPVFNMRCGIDTSFYRAPSSFTNVPENYREVAEKLLAKPYMILPGDELRFNHDALDLVTEGGISLVRISQYSNDDMLNMQKEIRRRGIEDRFFIFEKISYSFMRFLLQHAAVYAGLVNSEWQPAGWTVACEALASGLPIVLYEGLVSRELARLGATEDILKSVPMRDTRTFQEMLEDAVRNHHNPHVSQETSTFSAENLNLEMTGEEFVRQVESSLSTFM